MRQKNYDSTDTKTIILKKQKKELKPEGKIRKIQVKNRNVITSSIFHFVSKNESSSLSFWKRDFWRKDNFKEIIKIAWKKPMWMFTILFIPIWLTISQFIVQCFCKDEKNDRNYSFIQQWFL